MAGRQITLQELIEIFDLEQDGDITDLSDAEIEEFNNLNNKGHENNRE
jgi:hypothetical protein